MSTPRKRPAVCAPSDDPAYERQWTKRRRYKRLDNPGLIIELVPGPRPYFWIGERQSGEYITSIDADVLAAWIDDLRGAVS